MMEKELTILFTNFTASPTDVAWNPMVDMLSTSSATVMFRWTYLLKSIPVTSVASAVENSDGLRTASVALLGAASAAWMGVAMLALVRETVSF